MSGMTKRTETTNKIVAMIRNGYSVPEVARIMDIEESIIRKIDKNAQKHEIESA